MRIMLRCVDTYYFNVTSYFCNRLLNIFAKFFKLAFAKYFCSL
jgi:hypothetical protein